MLGSSTLQSSAEPWTILIFGLFGIIANVILWYRGFFSIPTLKQDFRKWSLLQCLMCLGIYIANALLITPLLFQMLFSWDLPILKQPVTSMVVLQSLNIACNLLLLSLYLLLQPKNQLKYLWKDPQMAQKGSYFYDLLLGFFTWFISFPLIVAINALGEFINQLLFHFQEVDQVAVRFLKLSSTTATTLVLAVIMILIAAPFIEEFLFRGCLQTWIRSRLGTWPAILLTSMIFSMMHFAPSQGFSNIPLLSSLFFLSLYLGLLYEKTRSLLSPIILHMTFNGISVMRILFS